VQGVSPVRRPCNRRVAAIRRRISGTWTRRHERPDGWGTQETGGPPVRSSGARHLVTRSSRVGCSRCPRAIHRIPRASGNLEVQPRGAQSRGARHLVPGRLPEQTVQMTQHGQGGQAGRLGPEHERAERDR